MGFFSQITDIFRNRARSKTQEDPRKFFNSTIGILDGAGQALGKPWPFNYTAAMMQCQSWVYAAAMGNARAAAAIPLRLYVRGRRLKSGNVIHPLTQRNLTFTSRSPSLGQRAYLKGKSDHKPSTGVLGKIMAFGDDFQEVDQHPMITLLREINPYMNGFDFTVLRFLCLELTGNFYVHSVTGPVLGRPVPQTLWPMLPHLVHIVPADPNENLLVQRYMYGSGGANRQSFGPDEVGHFRYPNPRDMFYGLGKVEAAWSALHIHHAKRTADIAFFENNARPDFLMIVKPGTTEQQIDRFDAKLNKMLRGTHRASRFLTVTGDISAQPMQFPPADIGEPSQILEEISAVFGYPMTKLRADHPNRANAEAADTAWMKDTILPMLRQDEERLNEWLLPMFPQELRDNACLAYDDPVPRNRQQARADRQNLFRVAALSPNEARADAGLGPVEGGDEPLAPAALVPLSRLGMSETD